MSWVKFVIGLALMVGMVAHMTVIGCKAEEAGLALEATVAPVAAEVIVSPGSVEALEARVADLEEAQVLYQITMRPVIEYARLLRLYDGETVRLNLIGNDMTQEIAAESFSQLSNLIRSIDDPELHDMWKGFVMSGQPSDLFRLFVVSRVMEALERLGQGRLVEPIEKGYEPAPIGGRNRPRG